MSCHVVQFSWVRKCQNDLFQCWGSSHEAVIPSIVGNKAKWQISKRMFQENNARQIFWKTNISCVSGGKKCLFFGNLACFVFLKHPFWDLPFCLITDSILIEIYYKCPNLSYYTIKSLVSPIWYTNFQKCRPASFGNLAKHWVVYEQTHY